MPTAPCLALASVLALLFWPSGASAQEPSGLNEGDTAWVITATALVLFMTLPGLALFYGGLVRARNLLSVLMHCFSICCLVSVLWLAVAYSLVFDPGNAVIGGLGRAFLGGAGTETLAGTVPEVVYFMFQMTFAIITPALIVGAYPERITFPAVLLFSAIWLLLVYAPVAHWIWGGGWLAALGVMDFAGGLVVHLTAGASALVLALVLGPRRGFPHERDHAAQPRDDHGRRGDAVGRLVRLQWRQRARRQRQRGHGDLRHARFGLVGALTWAADRMDQIRQAEPGRGGHRHGRGPRLDHARLGLRRADRRPDHRPAGRLRVPVGDRLHQQVRRIDDSLDVFAVHGVGGMLGTLLTAFLATEAFGGLGIAVEGSTLAQFGVQLLGVVAVGVCPSRSPTASSRWSAPWCRCG